MRIITLNREFGSGGRELGKRLADALGFAYYDKELISAIAEKSNLDKEYINKTIESGVWKNYPVTINHTFNYIPVMENPGPNLISWQSEVIREIAKKGDCVIVGRAADAILADENPLRIFVYADCKSKIARCRKRAPEDENLSDREMEKKIRKIDKARAASHDLVSSCGWSDKDGYELMINTSSTEIPLLIPSLADYCRQWFDSSCKEK